MFSVSNSCDYNDNSKNDENCLQTNARPSGPTPTNPRPHQAKIRMHKSPGVGADFWCKSPGVRAGGVVVIAKTDSCINSSLSGVFSLYNSLISCCYNHPMCLLPISYNNKEHLLLLQLLKVLLEEQRMLMNIYGLFPN